MDGKLLSAHFERIGARVRVQETRAGSKFQLDIGRDRDGQFFDMYSPDGAVEPRVVDVDESLRHLLLLGVNEQTGAKRRFLCGHDEREWFACAVPGASVSRVRQAMEALKPVAVRQEQERKGVRGSARLKRRTAAYVRQGEWFFLPRPELKPPTSLVLRNEPLSRGFGKAHWVDMLYRKGGESVMVCSQRSYGVSLAEYREIIRAVDGASGWNWRPMRANATAYVKGCVRHPDHATVRLNVWHEVFLNTEREAPGARNVVFLD